MIVLGAVIVRLAPLLAAAREVPPVVPEIVNWATALVDSTRSPEPSEDNPAPLSPVKVTLGVLALPKANAIGPAANAAASNLLSIAVDILPNSTSYAAPNIVLAGFDGGRESLGVKNVVWT